eukprot:TRINITY_DN23878_c0_g1_i1.p2 TRINITY_DN23878_c0_g1~~TRINITY_DN23878_c0_g1_i1.p2  ORF type:complete len:127 (+),score=60.57 TRINITY_DN23878_c0_g1_i1:91-471(+)
MLLDSFLPVFFFFSSRRRHTRCREVSWARRCVQETGINAEYMGSKLITIRRDGKMKKMLKKKMWLLLMILILMVGCADDNNENQSEIARIAVTDVCLLYTSDAADDTPCVDLGGRRIIKKKKTKEQ